MRIVISKAFGNFSVGHVVEDAPGNLARLWIDRGLARKDRATVSVPVDKMMRPVVNPFRRKPR